MTSHLEATQPHHDAAVIATARHDPPRFRTDEELVQFACQRPWSAGKLRLRDLVRVLTLVTGLEDVPGLSIASVGLLYKAVPRVLRSTDFNHPDNVQALVDIVSMLASQRGTKWEAMARGVLGGWPGTHLARLIATGQLSAAQVSLVSWAYGRAMTWPKNGTLWKDIAAYVIAHAGEMDCASLGRALWGLAEVGYTGTHVRYEEVCAAVEAALTADASKLLDAQEIDIALLASSFCLMSEPAPRLMHALAVRATQLLAELLPTERMFSSQVRKAMADGRDWWSTDAFVLRTDTANEASAATRISESTESAAGHDEDLRAAAAADGVAPRTSRRSESYMHDDDTNEDTTALLELASSYRSMGHDALGVESDHLEAGSMLSPPLPSAPSAPDGGDARLEVAEDARTHHRKLSRRLDARSARSLVTIAWAFSVQDTWHGPFFAYFKRLYPRLCRYLDRRDFARLLTVNLALQHVSPLRNLALGAFSVQQRKNAEVDGPPSRPSDKKLLNKAVVRVLDPCGQVRPCQVPAMSQAALRALLEVEGVQRERGASMDGPPSPQFMSEEGLIFDFAWPQWRTAVRVATPQHFAPRHDRLSLAFQLEQRLAVETGWDVHVIPAFDVKGAAERASVVDESPRPAPSAVEKIAEEIMLKHATQARM